MLILLWILYVVLAAIFFIYFYINISQSFVVDWVCRFMVTACAVLWPIVLIISYIDILRLKNIFEESNNNDFNILVPQENLGIVGKDRYEKIAAYLVGKDNNDEEIDYVSVGFKHDGDSNSGGKFTSVYHIKDAEDLCPFSEESVSCDKEHIIREDQGVCQEKVQSVD